MKIALKCIYTIVHTAKLNELAAKGGNLNHSEKKPWVTGKKLLNEALQRGETMFVVFSPAELCHEVIYYAQLQNIVTNADKSTTFYFKNLKATEEPRPLKEELVVAESGETIHPDHIRPYVICETPEWLEEMMNSEK